MSAGADSPASLAQDYIGNPRFHQRFTLEPTATHGAVEVTYAEYGREPDGTTSIPTILLMPGMFSSRYLGLALHPIATKLGVRLLTVDRPGMGGSTDVPLAQRVSIWLETVPRLLANLAIQHVALASHSAGTIYLLNTLYHCRDLVSPNAPVTMLAPWVDPAFSRITSMQMAQYLPNKAFSLWDRIPRFFLLQAGPAFASSGAVVKKVTNAISSPGSGAHDITQQEKTRLHIEEFYGLPRDVQAELENLIFRRIFQESTVGSNSEALQCLRKEANTWGKCEDYQVFVRDFRQLERDREGSALMVHAYFAESDSMIGKKGQQYFEECWQGTDDDDNLDSVNFISTTVPGTDHDTLATSVEIWEKIIGDLTRALDHGSQPT
ncbi:hypothetical protein N7492_009603 [Penicillium capsulatum]|uniref:AB hydrolase-1 domain-containing protein n=1 Tax=Penicillium capsulatum TaxID=69766 RepID=A0A9W9HV03_9EURO|nr:hypothetical protein N7492_009603 [Penicillium capsulatum]KAJ6106991.1 hypothetical protein N7512_010508 [Penicillium capsulatum]